MFNAGFDVSVDEGRPSSGMASTPVAVPIAVAIVRSGKRVLPVVIGSAMDHVFEGAVLTEEIALATPVGPATTVTMSGSCVLVDFACAMETCPLSRLKTRTCWTEMQGS